MRAERDAGRLNDTRGHDAGASDARSPAKLWQALKDVRDPELPISVVDLGLIYDIRRDGRRVEVDMTFTATACPCMGFIKSDIEERLLKEGDVDDVVIHVVWDPPWTRDRMSDEGRAVLRQYGVAA
jgi:metal-sulfur cluster biosynthetic enzyme